MKKFKFTIREEETTWATTEEEGGLVFCSRGGGAAWIHVTESKIRRWVRKNSVMDFQI